MGGRVWKHALVATTVVVCTTTATAAESGREATTASPFTHHLANLINAYRAQNGLGPLEVAEDLADLALEHSASMSERRQLSHEGFRARFQRTRSRLCVENVGWNHRTPEALLEGWRLSPAHHRNLLDPGVSRMGIAAAARYVTFFACR